MAKPKATKTARATKKGSVAHRSATKARHSPPSQLPDPCPAVAPLSIREPLSGNQRQEIIERILTALRERGNIGRSSESVRELLKRLDGCNYMNRV